MRIGITNDLLIATETLREILVRSGQHQVAWTAPDGAEAVRLCAVDKPDLVLMDLSMPGMDGLPAIRQIMAQTPCPILVVTASVNGSSARVFEALGAGALDAVNTPSFGSEDKQADPAALLFRIETIGRLIGKLEGKSQKAEGRIQQPGTKRREAGASYPTANSCHAASDSSPLVVIGSSAGGPAALATLLRQLDPQFPAGIVIVQHLAESFASGLVDWLGQQSSLPVRLAREGDRPAPGVVLVAGTSDHLVFVNHNTLGYTPLPKEGAYRPSVDVFFTSVSEHRAGEVIGVLLTGMGRDGARGLRTLREAGHLTLAQDRASCAVYGMPKAAAELDAASEILALEKIAPRWKQHFNRSQPGARAVRRASLPTASPASPPAAFPLPPSVL